MTRETSLALFGKCECTCCTQSGINLSGYKIIVWYRYIFPESIQSVVDSKPKNENQNDFALPILNSESYQK